MNTNCCVFSQNVRGLNDPDKHGSVRQTILSAGPTIAFLIACYEDYFDINLIPYALIYSISVKVSSRLDDVVWDLTRVYDLQQENEKMIFLSEMCNIHNLMKQLNG